MDERQSGTVDCWEMQQQPQSGQTTILSNDEEPPFGLDRLVQPQVEAGRRTIVISRTSIDESYGMILQSDLVQAMSGTLKRYTYLDSVETGGLAYKSGMRSGDILLGVNGSEVLSLSHDSLLSLLSSTLEARIVVLAREHARLIELHSRRFMLRARLKVAEEELCRVTGDEEALLARYRNRLRNSSISLSMSPSPTRVSRGIMLTKIDRIESTVSLPPYIPQQITRL